MLHKDVLMADIDVDQWRNAQSLVLRSAKGARRLVVIHDKGRVVKFRHTAGAAVQGQVDTVTDAGELARRLYDLNRKVVDFVVVMERDAVDTYFAHIQDSWDIDADLDHFVHDTYEALNKFPDGIVAYPGTARTTLGMQWDVGASLEEVEAAVRQWVTPGTTVILAVHADDQLWASLVLDFDQDYKVISITTADPSRVDIHGDRDATLGNVTSWVEGQGKSVCLALNLDRRAGDLFLRSHSNDKKSVLRELLDDNVASVSRAPEALLAG